MKVCDALCILILQSNYFHDKFHGDLLQRPTALRPQKYKNETQNISCSLCASLWTGRLERKTIQNETGPWNTGPKSLAPSLKFENEYHLGHMSSEYMLFGPPWAHLVLRGRFCTVLRKAWNSSVGLCVFFLWPPSHLQFLFWTLFPLYCSHAPVAQRYHVTSDTLGREFDPGKRDFSH